MEPSPGHIWRRSCSSCGKQPRAKKRTKEKVFGADIPRTSGGRSPKTSGRPSKPWKNKHLGADFHDPNSRTSITPGGAQKLRAENFRALIFRSLYNRVLPEDYCKEDPCNFPWGGELARSRPRVGQSLRNSVYKISPRRFRAVFLP